MAPLDTIKALSGQRWRIAWSLLVSGPGTVSELGERLELPRDAVSRHLIKMRRAKIVKVKKMNQERIYRLTNSTAFTYFVSYLKELGEEK